MDLRSSIPKENGKFEILIAKIFSLKQKANQILSATLEKIKFCLFKKTVYGSFRQDITTEKCKIKAIQADIDIFTHILACSGLFKRSSLVRMSESRRYVEYQIPPLVLFKITAEALWLLKVQQTVLKSGPFGALIILRNVFNFFLIFAEIRLRQKSWYPVNFV